MTRPIAVGALQNFRIWLRYDDGTEGEVDLHDLARQGVFQAWDDVAFFNAVRLGSHGAIEWGSDIDLCPDALYLRLTGRSPEDIACRSSASGWSQRAASGIVRAQSEASS